MIRLYDTLCTNCGFESEMWEDYTAITQSLVRCPQCQRPVRIKIAPVTTSLKGTITNGEIRRAEVVIDGKTYDVRGRKTPLHVRRK